MYKQLDLFSTMVEKPVVSVPEEKSVSEPAAINFEEELKYVEPTVEFDIQPLELQQVKPVTVFVSQPKIIAQKPVKQKRGRKSLKDMEAEASSIAVPADEILFKKQYYSIGEVATMFSLNTSLLRYWETEFDILKPRKNRKGDRHFRPEDIKNLVLIHHLLRQRKYTIEGAKDYLKKNKQKAQENFKLIQKLENLRDFLLELKAGL